MKSSHVLLALLAALIITPVAHGQDSAANQGEQRAEIKNKKGHEVVTVSEAPTGVPLKILVVISEYDGEKKIASLPYTLYTVTEGPSDPHTGTRQSMRYQSRVPIVIGSFQAGVGAPPKGAPLVNTQYQYQDVGTDIDYGAYSVGTDSYELVFSVDRSWASMPGPATDQTALERGSALTGQPILPHFRNSFVVVLKNGQTVEGASATDPVSGHVLKVDVTLTVLK